MARLTYDFYARSARTVARDLLGARLVRLIDGQRVAGCIVETEAYCDGTEPDLACHAERANQGRPTARTAVMFGPAGVAYVYFTYGIHWLFNIITGQPGQPNGVLIRALEPVEGEALIAANRSGRPRREWTNGPAKLTQALQIDQSFNEQNLLAADGVIWVEEDRSVPAEQIQNGPRIGLGQTPEPWFSKPWRYWIGDNNFVSK